MASERTIAALRSIELRGASKRYQGVDALAPTDLTVAAGERCVLISLSGCGTSALLRLINGLCSDPRGATERFAVERFAEAEALRAHAFTVPTDFHLDDEIQSGLDIHGGDPTAVHRVVVEFSKERAAYARGHEWHRLQQIED